MEFVVRYYIMSYVCNNVYKRMPGFGRKIIFCKEIGAS